MNNILVFYAGLLYGEYDVKDYRSLDLPDGSYIQGHHGGWFHKETGAAQRIPIEDVPKEIRLLTLLLT